MVNRSPRISALRMRATIARTRTLVRAWCVHARSVGLEPATSRRVARGAMALARRGGVRGKDELEAAIAFAGWLCMRRATDVSLRGVRALRSEGTGGLHREEAGR